MKEKTYDDNEYWNKVYRSSDQAKKEPVTLDGNDGESEFDEKVLTEAAGMDVLDVGCGDGSFSRKIAKKARRVVGIDFSDEALARATKAHPAAPGEHVRFRRADASNLPLADAKFDMVVSRRGPVTASNRTLAETYRVLKLGGLLMEITIGEKDKENLARVFGRGQMFGMKEKVAITKKKMLKKAGFKEIQTRDYIATEIFPSMKRLIIRLSDSPIIPGFELEKDRHSLETVERECSTSRGIETPVHRVIIIAKK